MLTNSAPFLSASNICVFMTSSQLGHLINRRLLQRARFDLNVESASNEMTQTWAVDTADETPTSQYGPNCSVRSLSEVRAEACLNETVQHLMPSSASIMAGT